MKEEEAWLCNKCVSRSKKQKRDPRRRGREAKIVSLNQQNPTTHISYNVPLSRFTSRYQNTLIRLEFENLCCDSVFSNQLDFHGISSVDISLGGSNEQIFHYGHSLLCRDAHIGVMSILMTNLYRYISETL